MSKPRVNALPARGLLKERSGSVAVVFALTLTPVLLSMAVALEYSHSSGLKSVLDSASDAAALASVINARDTLVAGGYQTGSLQFNQAIANAQDVGVRLFNSKVRSVAYNPSVTVAVNNRDITATVKYEATMRSWFGGFLGVSPAPVAFSGTATAAASLPLYENIYVMLDVSGSMGIGADYDNQSKIWYGPYRRPDNSRCTFACHTTYDAADTYPKLKTYYSGLGNPLKTRIDVLKESLTKVLKAAQDQVAKNGIKDQFRFGLYSFANRLTTVLPMHLSDGVTINPDTYDYTKITYNLSLIDLVDEHYGTNYNRSLSELSTNTKILQSGTGNGPTSPKNVLLIITDGIEDFIDGDKDYVPPSNPNAVPGSRQYLSPDYTNNKATYVIGATATAPNIVTQNFQPKLCDKFKQKGVDIYFLHVQYLISPLETTGSSLFDVVREILPSDLSTLPARSCPDSPTKFTSANSPSEIDTAVRGLFGMITRNPALTK